MDDMPELSDKYTGSSALIWFVTSTRVTTTFGEYHGIYFDNQIDIPIILFYTRTC